MDRRRTSSNRSFVLRLVVAVAGTAVLIGGIQYGLVSRNLTGRVVDQAVAAHIADGVVLEHLYNPAATDPWHDVTELLSHIVSRPGIVAVGVYDEHGDLIMAGDPHLHGHGGGTPGGDAQGHGASGTDGDPGRGADEASGDQHGASTTEDATDHSPEEGTSGHTSRHLDTLIGETIATEEGRGAVSDTHSDRMYVVVPLAVPDHNAVLAVSRGTDTLGEQIGEVQRVLLLSLLLGFLLSVPLFMLLGGRRLSAKHTQALRRATSDGLTGLMNHRMFHERLREEMAAALQIRAPLSLALVDLDAFKETNDTNGHLHGDAVLVKVAELLRSGRDGDLAFRIGGDEFAVLYRNTPLTDATIAAERLRAQVEERIENTTVSIGLTQLTERTTEANTLIREADEALYRAKRQGRNQLQVASDAMLVAYPRSTT